MAQSSLINAIPNLSDVVWETSIRYGRLPDHKEYKFLNFLSSNKPGNLLFITGEATVHSSWGYSTAIDGQQTIMIEDSKIDGLYQFFEEDSGPDSLVLTEVLKETYKRSIPRSLILKKKKKETSLSRN